MKVLLSVLMAIAVSSPLALAKTPSSSIVQNPQAARTQFKGHNPTGTAVCRNKSGFGRHSDFKLPKQKDVQTAEVLKIRGVK